MINALRNFVGIEPRSYTLSVPRIEENEGLLLLGDPGTGKSQVIHQLLDNIAKRKPQEAVVVYDPAGEFIEKHFDPDEDIVLNPLDARCPYWMPSYEGTWGYETAPTRQFIAESFFPLPDNLATNTQFFIKAARSIFAQMLMFNPHPERIVEMLSEDDLIDYCVAGQNMRT
jgi:predicted ATPase